MDRRGSAHIITRTLGFLFITLVTACHMVTTEKPVAKTQPNTVETTCKSGEYTYLIGRNKSALDSITLPEPTRILHPGMAMTMDYLEGRLNFYLDKKGKIMKLSCG